MMCVENVYASNIPRWYELPLNAENRIQGPLPLPLQDLLEAQEFLNITLGIAGIFGIADVCLGDGLGMKYIFLGVAAVNFACEVSKRTMVVDILESQQLLQRRLDKVENMAFGSQGILGRKPGA